MIYKGVVTPAEIKLDVSVFDMPFELVVKKESNATNRAMVQRGNA